MAFSRAYRIALLLLPQLLLGQDAASIARELLALRPGMTAAAWLATHPQDKFEPYPASGRDMVEHREWCAVASTTLTFGQIPFLRRAYFYLPSSAALMLPRDDAPHPELVKQCSLSEIQLESLTGISPVLLGQIKSAMTASLGTAKPFRYDHKTGALLDRGTFWVDGKEWHARGGARWIVAVEPEDGRFASLALSPAANENPNREDFLAPSLVLARQFLPLALRSADETRQMKELLDSPVPEYNEFKQPKAVPINREKISSLLVRWATANDGTGSEARSASLFVAHVALEHAGRFHEPDQNRDDRILLDDPDFRKPLEAAGAHFQYYDPGGDWLYEGDWLVDAWRAAPESAPGRQSYLIQLELGFNLRGTCGGDADKVVRSGEEYLREHRISPIRRAVLLNVADGYAEKVALRYAGLEWGSEVEASKAFPVALKYYRRVIAMAPKSGEAQEAKMSAWLMLANPVGLPVRWNCLDGD